MLSMRIFPLNISLISYQFTICISFPNFPLNSLSCCSIFALFNLSVIIIKSISIIIQLQIELFLEAEQIGS